MTESQRRAIAERLRSLLAGQGAGDIAATAQRLGVNEISLRMSIDELSPYPTVDVIAAAVRHYAVDPNYLLNGEYDTALHRRVIEDPHSANAIVGELALRRDEDRHVARPTDDATHFRQP